MKKVTIYTFTKESQRKIGAWDSSTGMLNLNIFINLFPFIKWEDEEPTSIEKLLNNCEVVDNEDN